MTTVGQSNVGAADLACLQTGFGLDAIEQETESLSGGLSGDQTCAVRCRQGRFVIKHWAPEDLGYAEKTAARQEAARDGGAPVPAHIQSRNGRFLESGTTVREFAPGLSLASWSVDQGEAFGRALGRLDRALAECPADSFFVDQSSVFSRCKDTEHVATRYLPACDSRFPVGYREHLISTITELKARLAPIADEQRDLVHVDANPDNAIFDEAGDVRLIDLTPEARHRGYSLGAALYWWAYPWRSNHLNVEVLRAVARGYLGPFPLSPRRQRAIAAHMLNHSLMELAFPLGCLVDGPPPGARHLEDLDGRLRRAIILLAEIDQVERAVMEQ